MTTPSTQIADREKLEASFREEAARLLHKYVQAYKPYDGEFEQTLDYLVVAAGLADPNETCQCRNAACPRIHFA